MLGSVMRGDSKVDNAPPVWLRRVTDRLNEEFTQNITTNSLAAEAGVHPVYLASVFRRFHRQTIGEYIQKLRIAHASKLLSDHAVPLTDIAYTCGFADQSHFTRVFKRRIGITPGVFRDSLT
jgi:AraC family transcriptional regulator